jgi:hypothetical protein
MRGDDERLHRSDGYGPIAGPTIQLVWRLR